jgi:ERCC4-related helicase
MKISPGDFVEARGRRWLVDDVISGSPDRHRLICVDDDAQGETLDVTLAAEIAATKVVEDGWNELAGSQPDDPITLGAHLRAIRWRTASAADRKLFQAPFRAGIRLDAYQLLPLQRALELPRANLLIADDVGLGKTVEAGLIARELLLRRRIDFLLIAAPSSMVLQWQDEMAQKFGLDVTIIDREHLLRTRRARGFGANPWVLGSCFAISHSLLSDEVYMAPLRQMLTDFRARSLFILDEAHHAAPSSGQAYAVESQMTRAVRDLAGRFEHRLFLSATPHNGHSNSFATLLEILDPQRFTRGIPVEPADLAPVMIRRLKEDLRQLGETFPKRSIEAITIDDLPADAPELRLAEMLQDYWEDCGTQVGNRLLLGILQQRLFSSITAFSRSLRAHRRTLDKKSSSAINPQGDGVEDERLQEDDLLIEAETRVPLGSSASATPLARVDAMLALCDAAASQPDARIDHILRWIDAEMLDGRDWQRRRLIIFTEWEDTRRWLVDALKSGLSTRGVDDAGRIALFTGQTTSDARDRIKRAFNAPFEDEPIRILVCTDAAREGINLQTRCHDLIHFDLPWNPSRLEQRNGRIDRKLQPNPTVTCRYFIYAQRAEDRVLDALVRKTERIRQELGSTGQVIHDALAGGIRRGQADASTQAIRSASSDRSAVARREMGEDGRLERLKIDEARLAKAREEARRKVGVEPDDLRALVELALERMGTTMTKRTFSVDGAGGLAPADPALRSPSWQTLIDELRPGRAPIGKGLAEWRQENPPRGILFAPPVLQPGQPEPQDVVQLHLEHRLVKRLLSRFVAKGFQDDLTRVAAIMAPTGQHRVVMLARLALYGPGARRLHEEIITVAAPWRDSMRDKNALVPFKDVGEETTLRQLQDALQTGIAAGDAVSARIAPWVHQDVEDLKLHVEARADASRLRAVGQLHENGVREAEALQELLMRQLARIERERTTDDPRQLTFNLPQKEEQQRQADRRAWDHKVDRLRTELEKEPGKVRESYEVRAQRLDPIGLVYLWPTS